VRLWDVASHKQIGIPLTGHTDEVLTVAFSPDGKTLASTSNDKTVRLWDVASRQPLGEALTGHTDVVKDVAFSPDGKMLASWSRDMTVRLWDVDPTSWISRACERANRNLSQAEWRQYMGASFPFSRTCRNLPDGEGELTTQQTQK
jgi:WD40 repeat protein